MAAKKPAAPVSRAVGPPDGRAFANAVLEKARRRGAKVRVAFDIDDTLADSRVRTLALAKAWDLANRPVTHHFDRLTLAQVGHTGAETARALELPLDAEQAFSTWWETAFWEGENFKYDAPLTQTVALARQLQQAGAEVVFLTGRTQDREAATIEQLRGFGLQADAASVVCKPELATRTVPFKARWLAEHPVSFFLTESRRDVAGIAQAGVTAQSVLLESRFSGVEAVGATVPIYPKAQARPVDVQRSVAAALASPLARPRPVARASDGAAFVEAQLADVAARVARGEKVRVGFGVDDTLADTRTRSLGLMRTWDQQHGTRYFARLKPEDVKQRVRDTLKGVDLPWDAQRDFLAFYRQRFHDGGSYGLDTPMPAIVTLAQRARAAGAQVVYLTGRPDSRLDGTTRWLREHGLGDAEAGVTVFAMGAAEPAGSPQLTTTWLRQSAREGWHLALFLTGSRDELAAVQSGMPGAPGVLVAHPFNGSRPPRDDTPVYPSPLGSHRAL